jgi:ribosomal protein S18 acetylase RimI-like enzyme
MTRSTQQAQEVVVREMGVDDIPAVYRLGLRLFKSQEESTFYRTWDAYEVTNNFNQNPHLCLIAKSDKGRIVGFVLGTTYENESGAWKYGYILWIGVSAKWQRSGAGSQLYRAIERRMHHEGVRMMFVDTAQSNTGAIRFFNRMGYGKPEAEVWMSKLIQRARKGSVAAKQGGTRLRNWRARIGPRIARHAQ